ncbi:hypothetical protein, partial [Roseburia sp. AF42-8]|uniref:hypothetical protein n=1 Tax=Roseburia sp. AF42-8 TaxID=2293137 RepID=UPI000E97F643
REIVDMKENIIYLMENYIFKKTEKHLGQIVGNSRYEREYHISDGKLYIQENGETSWADSRYDRSWIASDEEEHRFYINI